MEKVRKRKPRHDLPRPAPEHLRLHGRVYALSVPYACRDVNLKPGLTLLLDVTSM